MVSLRVRLFAFMALFAFILFQILGSFKDASIELLKFRNAAEATKGKISTGNAILDLDAVHAADLRYLNDGERQLAEGACEKHRYISASGSDTNDGCNQSSPLETLSACAALAGDGGVCYLAPGRYFMHSVIKKVADLTIEPVPGSPAGSVIFDGTVPITGWTKEGSTYRSDTNQSAWQLFVNGEPLTSARWPNAKMWSADAWSPKKTWARQAEGSVCGHSVDAGTLISPIQALAATQVSMNGCNLIMNNEHWVTRRYVVKNHTAGTGNLSYDKPENLHLCDKYGSDINVNQYFIDGCLAAFDSPGEWAYDSNQRIVVHPPEGVDFQTADVRGKVQTYALALVNCDRAKVRNIGFFGTALFVYESPGVEISGNEFNYSSASRRSLGSAAREFDAATAYGAEYLDRGDRFTFGHGLTDIFIPGNFLGTRPWKRSDYKFIDNSIYRAEGAGIYCWHCVGDLFENNAMTECGYPFSRSLFMFGFRGHQTIRRNSIAINGAGGINQMWGLNVTATLNDVSGCGKLVTDNDCIGGGTPSVKNIISYNWLHDATALGLRYDSGDDGRFPNDDHAMFNVVWNCLQGGIANKAHNASIYRNTAIANQGGSDPESTNNFGSAAADFKIAQCYPADCVATTGLNAGKPNSAVANIGSIIRGNVGQMSPGTIGLQPHQLPGTHDHNLNLLVQPTHGLNPTLDELFRDYRNLDFRPLSGSVLVDAGAEIPSIPDPSVLGSAPDIGAYEMDSPVYWIPGRQLAKATAPVPPSGATGVRPNADLMFLPAKSATSHEVFVGTSSGTLASVGALSEPNNIFTPQTKFVPGATYYWKVIATFAQGPSVSSETWSFTVGCADFHCVDCGSSTGTSSCIKCSSPWVLSHGICAPKGGCAGGDWSITATPSWYGSVKIFKEAGNYEDTFSISTAPAAGCANDNLLKMNVMRTSGNSSTIMGGLSCNNQQYQIDSVFTCSTCASGFVVDSSMPSGCRNSQVPEGGCQIGSWSIAAAPSSYGVALTLQATGTYRDTFSAVKMPLPFCATYRDSQGNPLDQWQVMQNTSSSPALLRVGGLSCTNQQWQLTPTFTCQRCADGFVANITMSSGCKPIV